MTRTSAPPTTARRAADRAAMRYMGVLARVVRNGIAARGVDHDTIRTFLDIDPADYSRKFDGRDPWSILDLVRLAALMGIEPHELLATAERSMAVLPGPRREGLR